jgi:hypothetical protein
MAIPVHWNSAFRYKETLAVTDVQTIINDLYVELVTNGGWTCILGGSGQTPTTYKSPARADGLFFTIKLTRISATRIAYIVNDHNGMLVNNATDTRQDIDAGGTTVHYYTGPFHFCVSSERVTPEGFYCGLADTTPDMLGKPRATYFASYGPRDTAGTWLVAGGWNQVYVLNIGIGTLTSYTAGAKVCYRGCSGSTYAKRTMGGTWQCEPVELTDNGGYLLGRMFQAVSVDTTQFAFGAEVTVPLDGTSTGVFKTVGCMAALNSKLAFRKA